MRKYLFLILLIASLSSSQDWLQYYYYGQNNNAQVFTPVFTGLDTSSFPFTPYTAELVFDGNTRGQFGRILNKHYSADGTLHGLSWIYATNAKDSVIWTFDIAIGLPRKAQFPMGYRNNQGWLLSFGNGAANDLEISIGTGLLKWVTLAVNDSTYHFYKAIWRKADNTILLYQDGALVNTHTSVTMPANNLADTSYSMCLGNGLGTQNSTADTTQQSTNTTQYGRFRIKSFSMAAYNGTTDTTGTWKFIGYGQNIPCIVTSGGNVIKGGVWDYDRADYTKAAPYRIYNMELGGSPAPDRKDPRWHILTGSAPGYIEALGSGVTHFDSSANVWWHSESFVNGETLWRNHLVVSGTLNDINISSVNSPSTPAVGMAKMNLSTGVWTAVTTAMVSTKTSIYCLASYNNNLIGGGEFTDCGGVAGTLGIFQFDGSAVSSLDSSFNNTVLDLDSSLGNLYAAGLFTQIGGTSGYGRVAYFNGTQWNKLGSGMDGTVSCTAGHLGEQYFGGSFTTANGVSCTNIAKWNGSTFVALSSGISDPVNCLKSFNGKLYAGTAPSGATANVYEWNGTSFTSIASITLNGNTPAIIDMTVNTTYNNLVVVGQFSRVNGRACGKMFYYNGSDITVGPFIDLRPEGVLSTGSYELVPGDGWSAYGVESNNVIKITPTWITR